VIELSCILVIKTPEVPIPLVLIYSFVIDHLYFLEVDLLQATESEFTWIFDEQWP
jgi:hypothetical protein